MHTIDDKEQQQEAAGGEDKLHHRRNQGVAIAKEISSETDRRWDDGGVRQAACSLLRDLNRGMQVPPYL